MKLAQRLIARAVPVVDPYWDNVTFLIQPPDDAGNGSTSIVDLSNSAVAVTTNNDVVISTALGVPAVHFDGNDYLIFAYSAGLLFGSGDFTIDILAHIASGVSGKAVGIWYDTSGDGFSWKVMFRSDNKWRLVCSTTGADTVLYEAPAASSARDKMSMYSICRYGNTLRFFVDGAFVYSTSFGINIYTTNYTKRFEMGRDNAGDTAYITGYFRAVRITKGIARYQTDSNFTQSEKFPTS